MYIKYGDNLDKNNLSIDNSIYDLYNFIKYNGWDGYDPYDGLNSKLLSPISLGNKWVKLFLISFNKISPINFRRFECIKKGTDIKGMGLFANAFLKFYEFSGDATILNNSQNCLDFLLSKSLKNEYFEHCWAGHYFEFQSINSNLKPTVPDIISTVTCASAFLQDFKTTGSNRSLDVVKSAIEFMIDDLYVEDGDKYFFKYTPKSEQNTIVYNASTCGVRLLSQVARYINCSNYLKVSENVMDYIVSKQKPDGSWYYSETNSNERKQIDFHQGFILNSLYDFIKILNTNDDTYMGAIKRGIDFYKNEQFTQNGICKYRWPRVYPIDIHNQAQGIITFSKMAEMNPEYLNFAQTIAKWTINNMQDEGGYFYYQKWPFFINKIPYMRWSQAWMMMALVSLIEALDR